MQIIKSTNFSSVPARPEYQTAFSTPPVHDISSPHFKEVLLAHKGIFIACLALCLAAGLLLTLSTRPVYQAKGVLELQPPPASTYNGDNGTSATPINAQSYDAWINTQIGILESDTLVHRVVARLKLEDRLNAEHPTGLPAFWLKILHRNRGPITRDQAFQIATDNLKVRQSRLNDLIEVLYNANDPRLAADFANTLAAEYEQQNLESRWQMAQNTEHWLNQHLNELRTKLEQSEAALQDYSRANGLLFVSDDKESVARDRLRQLQEELSKAQSDRIERQSQMEMAASVPPDSVPQVLDDASLKDYQIRIADLERQLAEDRQIYTATNPKVLIIQSQITALQSAMNKTQASVLARLKNEYEAALKDEQMLENQYTEQTRLVSGQDEKMIRYELLKHEADTTRTTYDTLAQKVKESSVNVALQATAMRVVDAAAPPDKPYKPDPIVNMAGGLLAGLVLGLTSVSLRHRSDRRVNKPGVMQRYLDTPELGVIPSAGPRTRSSGVRAWLDPNSPVSESFRSVMTSILFASGGRSGIRLTVITSPEAGEGKTTVASNLAATFAATGRRVLIVDADLRRPRLDKVFDLPNSPGLLECAEEINTRGQSAQIGSFIHPTSVTGLYLMPCGTCVNNNNNLLHTLRFHEVFSTLRADFDMVIVDAPPLLCVPEVRMMARLADGVVLVIRAGSTQVDEAISAEKYVTRDGGNLIGIVLNDAPLSSTPYYTRYISAPAT